MSLRDGRLFADESAYRFQARLYASGHISADPMPGASYDAATVPTEIFFEGTIQSPRGWFSKYPAGWPAILAVGYLLHIPWLMNPLLAVIQLACIWLIAKPFGALCQSLAVSFVASSLYFLMWSVGYMSHATAAVVALLALAATLRSIRDHSMRRLAIAFGLVVFATQVRPYTGAVIGAVCAAIALAGFRSERKMVAWTIAIISISAGASAAAMLFSNWIHTGDMLVSPYAVMVGSRAVREIAFSPSGILYNLSHYTYWQSIPTVTSMFPFLLLLAIYALAHERQHRFDIFSLALLFPALVLAHILMAVPSGGFNGERLYFEGFGPVAIVGARGAQLLIERWRISAPAFATAFAVMLGLQIVNCGFGVHTIDTVSRPYQIMYNLARHQDAPLVFLHEGPWFVAKHTCWNDLNWRAARRIYLVDPGPNRRDQVACRFGRPVWKVLSYNADTKSGLAVKGQSMCRSEAAVP